MPKVSNASENFLASSAAMSPLAHWLLFLLNNWTQSQPHSRARLTALSYPPAIDWWAPRMDMSPR